MTRMNLYDVTILYSGLPPFSTRVTANDEEHAKRIANYNAIAKGWPKIYTFIKAEQLKD